MTPGTAYEEFTPWSGVCPILSRRAGGCSVAFGAFLLCPQFTSTPRIVGCSQKGQCKCCAENYSTRSRWPGSNRHRPQFCFRAALPLSYSGRQRQSPAAIGKGGRGMDNPVSLLLVIPNIFRGVYTPFLIIYHGMIKSLFLNFGIICSPDKIINGHIVVVRYTYKL